MQINVSIFGGKIEMLNWKFKKEGKETCKQIKNNFLRKWKKNGHNKNLFLLLLLFIVFVYYHHTNKYFCFWFQCLHCLIVFHFAFQLEMPVIWYNKKDVTWQREREGFVKVLFVAAKSENKYLHFDCLQVV